MNSSSPSARSKVVLVEDHPMVRERLAQIINKDLEMEVVGEADNIREALSLIDKAKPDITIVDITLRGSSGLELIKDLKALGVLTPVLVLSMHDEALYAQRSLRAGARGYISKDEDSSEIIHAIRRVLAGDIYLSPSMTEKVVQRFSHSEKTTTASGISSLSDRELEIYRLFGQGRNTKEIGQLLSLGENTVSTYRHRIKLKLGLKNFTELYNRAARWVREQEV